MPDNNEFLIYVGSANYEGGTAKNIYAYRFDAATASTTPLGVVAETVNPGSLAVHPNRRLLYCTNEVGDYKGSKGGGVSAYAVDEATGKLTFLNDEFSGGANPAHLVLDKTNKYLVIANYFGGKVVVFALQAGGRLGAACASGYRDGSSVNKERQEGPHPHSVYMSPDNRYVLACDLGLDKVLVYRFDASKGSLAANDTPFASVNPGAGPRHLAFSRDGKFVYVVNELQSSVTAFSFEPTQGVLHALQTLSTLPPDFKGESTCAEIEVSPSGKILYASNRGDDSIAVFAIDGEKGTLKPLEHVSTGGKTPRAFAIDPTGGYMFVANQDSDEIVIFRIDAASGHLSPAGKALKAKSPTAVAFVPLT
jgi:6-phosphogluconolactonase